jgi:hypothetical protein
LGLKDIVLWRGEVEEINQIFLLKRIWLHINTREPGQKWWGGAMRVQSGNATK